ncbi:MULTISPECIES: hypothetical protein [Halomonas]|uniref:Uncharacterized protein n=1 Tax=Halomonas salipaludis TaxID=2032625 RepID=A0A2A2F3Y4_9GAMM|nr:hypothetical protein [Halomonas salipaludis]PAU79233.1 hypothetical protein CK498_02360 [Halomonas salipaludis]
MPERPALPVVTAAEFACHPEVDAVLRELELPPYDGCLAAGAYEALATRDAMLQAHIRRLEAVLRTTH